MKFAIVGCVHGELEKMYESIELIEKKENYKVDVILCCGDFQSTRNLKDLNCMDVPKQNRDIGTFYKYHKGEKTAPILTIFIGGDHEASNYLQELPYGGWVAPNIFYMGYAGIININGIRIGGISGIFKGIHYFSGHHEISPYFLNDTRSVYHVRQLEVFRLQQIQEPIDIFLSHEWPKSVYYYGDTKSLCRSNPSFINKIKNNTLGNDKFEALLHHLQPTYWFSAHLHCKFASLVPHKGTDKQTKFLALDKCLPGRGFLEMLDIESNRCETTMSNKLSYDLEWLTILNTTNHLINIKQSDSYMPNANKTNNKRYNFIPTADEKLLILKKFQENLVIPINFVRTAVSYCLNDIDADNNNNIFDIILNSKSQPPAQLNEQTLNFCNILGIDDPIALLMLLNNKLNYSNYSESSSIVTASLPTKRNNQEINETDNDIQKISPSPSSSSTPSLSSQPSQPPPSSIEDNQQPQEPIGTPPLET